MKCELLPDSSSFTFGNSETPLTSQKVRIWVTESVHTEFRVLEEGSAPLFMSLPQMRNLGMTLDLETASA